MRNPVGDASAESDCENDSAEAEEKIPAFTQGVKDGSGEIRTVLSPGSFSA